MAAFFMDLHRSGISFSSYIKGLNGGKKALKKQNSR